MQKMTNWEELEWRGLVKDVAGADIQEKINNESVTFYWGTDPTADSLHLGHYSSLVTAKRLMKMGHKPILLCGGATGRIGDPRPTSEREIISIENIRNLNKDKYQTYYSNLYSESNLNREGKKNILDHSNEHILIDDIERKKIAKRR